MNNDYSQVEIDNIIEELITVHISKLKTEELYFVNTMKHNKVITQEQRDVLIKLYDYIGEAGY